MALGLWQSAGVRGIIGAAFDTPHMTRELVGQGIDLFDAGVGVLRVCELALDMPLFVAIAGSRSNAGFVNTVHRNIVGSLPGAAARDSLVSQLQGSGGTMTQAELLMLLAAFIAPNEANINLVGLQQSGVDFV